MVDFYPKKKNKKKSICTEKQRNGNILVRNASSLFSALSLEPHLSSHFISFFDLGTFKHVSFAAIHPAAVFFNRMWSNSAFLSTMNVAQFYVLGICLCSCYILFLKSLFLVLFPLILVGARTQSTVCNSKLCCTATVWATSI